MSILDSIVNSLQPQTNTIVANGSTTAGAQVDVWGNALNTLKQSASDAWDSVVTGAATSVGNAIKAAGDAEAQNIINANSPEKQTNQNQTVKAVSDFLGNTFGTFTTKVAQTTKGDAIKYTVIGVSAAVVLVGAYLLLRKK